MDALASAVLAGGLIRSVRSPPVAIAPLPEGLPPTNPNAHIDVADPLDATVDPGFSVYPPTRPIAAANPILATVDDQAVIDGEAFFGAAAAFKPPPREFPDPMMGNLSDRSIRQIERALERDPKALDRAKEDLDNRLDALGERFINPDSWLGPFDYAHMHAVLAQLEPRDAEDAYLIRSFARDLENPVNLARIDAVLDMSPEEVATKMPVGEIVALAKQVLVALFPEVEISGPADTIFAAVAREYLPVAAMLDLSQLRGFYALLMRMVSQRMMAVQYMRHGMTFKRFIAVYVLAHDRHVLSIRDLHHAYTYGRDRAAEQDIGEGDPIPDAGVLRLWIGRRMHTAAIHHAETGAIDEVWPFRGPEDARLPRLKRSLSWPYVLKHLEIRSVPDFMYKDMVRTIRVNGDPIVITAPMRTRVGIVVAPGAVIPPNLRWFMTITDPAPALKAPFRLGGLPTFEIGAEDIMHGGRGVSVAVSDRAAYVFGLASDTGLFYTVTRFAHVVPTALCVRCRDADFRDPTPCHWSLDRVQALEGPAAMRGEQFSAEWHARQVVQVIGYTPPADFPYMMTAAAELWSAQINLEREPPDTVPRSWRQSNERLAQDRARHTRTLQQILMDMDLNRPDVLALEPNAHTLRSVALQLEYSGRPVDTEALAESRRALREATAFAPARVAYAGAHSANRVLPDFILYDGTPDGDVALRAVPTVLDDNAEHKRLVDEFYRAVETRNPVSIARATEAANALLLASNPDILETPVAVREDGRWVALA